MELPADLLWREICGFNEANLSYFCYEPVYPVRLTSALLNTCLSVPSQANTSHENHRSVVKHSLKGNWRPIFSNSIHSVSVFFLFHPSRRSWSMHLHYLHYRLTCSDEKSVASMKQNLLYYHTDFICPASLTYCLLDTQPSASILNAEPSQISNGRVIQLCAVSKACPPETLNERWLLDRFPTLKKEDRRCFQFNRLVIIIWRKPSFFVIVYSLATHWH